MQRDELAAFREFGIGQAVMSLNRAQEPAVAQNVAQRNDGGGFFILRQKLIAAWNERLAS